MIPKTGKGKMAKVEKDRKISNCWTHEKPKNKKANEGKQKKNCGCGQDCITYGVKEGNKRRSKIARDPDDDEMDVDGKKIPVTEFVLSII